MGMIKKLLGIKEDKDISAEEKEAARKRTYERAKKHGMKYDEYMKPESSRSPHLKEPKR